MLTRLSLKRCSKCGDIKAIGDFCREPRVRDGRTARCRSCTSKYHSNRYTSDPEVRKGNRDRMRARYNSESAREKALRSKYGITLEDFNTLLTRQDGRCAICQTDDPGGKGVFHVDHDHACCPGQRTCGQCLRGLLCFSCNTGGNWDTVPGWPVKAQEYLSQFSRAGAI